MIAIVICGSIVVFAQSQYPFLFLACPLVLYAAFRTGMNGTAIAVIVLLNAGTLPFLIIRIVPNYFMIAHFKQFSILNRIFDDNLIIEQHHDNYGV